MPRKKKFQHRKKDKKVKRLKLKSRSNPSPSKLQSPPTDLTVEVLDPTASLQQISAAVVLPSSEWINQSPSDFGKLQLCKIPRSCSQPLRIACNVTVHSDLSWSLFVYDKQIVQPMCSALRSFPTLMDSENLNLLLSAVETLKLCVGQPDPNYVSMVKAKKGKVSSLGGSVVAVLDNIPVEFSGNKYSSTIRTAKCEILSKTDKCSVCTRYRASLRSMYHRWNKHTPAGPSSVYTNERYLNTPEKSAKIDKLRTRARKAEQTVRSLTNKIQKLRGQGERLDANFQSDLISIMHDNAQKVKDAYPDGSFAKLFWDEQLKAASASDSRQVQWHPVIIKWCLNLKLLSSSSYHALRTTGFIKLPSERTLLDYTHYFANKVGFQDEVNQQLVEEVDRLSLPDTRKFVALLIDEMKVKEGLVFNKHTGEIVGFTSLGDINDNLLQLEQEGERPEVAKQLLTLMVRGLMFKLNFPYAHFASRGATGDVLFPIVWEAIRRLESSGIKVLCVTADGASPNRKFFRMHRKQKDPTSLYKTKNHYSLDGRSLYFVADPPHLIKTIRNCWSHSGENGTRLMQVIHIIVLCFVFYLWFRILIMNYVG